MESLLCLLCVLTWSPGHVQGTESSLQNQISLLQRIMQNFQAEMTLVTDRLHNAESELSTTKDELNAVKYELRQAEDKLAAVKHQGVGSQGSGDNLRAELEALKESENRTKEAVVVLKMELDGAKSEIRSLRTQLDNTLDITELNVVIYELESLREINETCRNASDEVSSMQLDLQTALNEINVLQSQQATGGISEGLGNLTREVDELKLDLALLTSEVNSSSELNSSCDDVITLRQEISFLNTTISRLEDNITNSHCCDVTGNKTEHDNDEPSAAFEVIQSTKQSGWTTLNFDTVSLNIGGAYNETTGLFTAPVSGTYLFWGDVDISYGGIDYNELYLVKGVDTVAKGYAEISPSIDHNVISVMGVVYLHKGETVHFEMMASYFAVEGSGKSSYGGTLIRAQ